MGPHRRSHRLLVRRRVRRRRRRRRQQPGRRCYRRWHVAMLVQIDQVGDADDGGRGRLPRRCCRRPRLVHLKATAELDVGFALRFSLLVRVVGASQASCPGSVASAALDRRRHRLGLLFGALPRTLTPCDTPRRRLAAQQATLFVKEVRELGRFGRPERDVYPVRVQVDASRRDERGGRRRERQRPSVDGRVVALARAGQGEATSLHPNGTPRRGWSWLVCPQATPDAAAPARLRMLVILVVLPTAVRIAFVQATAAQLVVGVSLVKVNVPILVVVRVAHGQQRPGVGHGGGCGQKARAGRRLVAVSLVGLVAVRVGAG
mmetsp:Transcript_1023/g.3130  ORF Transcript_1023/g.3130 Transcript_1023/m.3130 type:complete len:319 (-) Transcript_1023:969-1925(-)